MFSSFAAALLVTIQYLSHSNAVSSKSRFVFPISDRLRNRWEGLPDPQRVDVWTIHQQPSLQIASEHLAIFQGDYRKQSSHDLTGEEQQQIMEGVGLVDEFRLVEVEVVIIRNNREAAQKAEQYTKENPGSQWTGHWDTTIPGKTSVLRMIRSEESVRSDLALYSIIWQQSGRHNYLISYHRSNCRDDTVWVVCSGNQVLWLKSKVKRDQVPVSGETFPELIRTKKDKRRGMIRDGIQKLHWLSIWKCSVIIGVFAVSVAVLGVIN